MEWNVLFMWAQGEIPESQNLRLGFGFRDSKVHLLLVACVTFTINSHAPVRDWHVWQKSRIGRARNWAGQKPVPENGPVVGNKAESKREDLARPMAGSCCEGESPGGWCKMGMCKCQQQRPGNILCPFPCTSMFSVFKENFRLGKLEVTRPPGESWTVGGRFWEKGSV